MVLVLRLFCFEHKEQLDWQTGEYTYLKNALAKFRQSIFLVGALAQINHQFNWWSIKTLLVKRRTSCVRMRAVWQPRSKTQEVHVKG